jgi:glucose-1-phosphate thymidylyltransferase
MARYRHPPERAITVSAYLVGDHERYGAVEFDAVGRALSIEEKPVAPCSRFAVSVVYFYDSRITGIVAAVKPSRRGELEITDGNACYLELGALEVEVMNSGFACLDTGTFDSPGTKGVLPPEIAWRIGFTTHPWRRLPVRWRSRTTAEISTERCPSRVPRRDRAAAIGLY